ncbi:MAG: hypothetical protein M1831_006307 [Alyxoria varia]|nr:MAG: hypothetical protein M1831_006307 [Alyxoria varia]
MASSKPILVIIHAEWHVPASYSSFIDSLKAHGYRVEVPLLPSMNGAHPPNADLMTDTAFIRNYVEKLVNAGFTIAALMHSYGGQVGSNALAGLGVESRSKQGLKGGVANLFYVCAFALAEGESMMGMIENFGQQDFLREKFHFAEDGTVRIRDPKALLVGGDVDRVQANKYISQLVLWNGKNMEQAIKRCAWREIPVTYIHGRQDQMIPYDYQRLMVRNLRAGGSKVETFQVDTGHCPHLTRTKELVNMVRQVLRKVGGCNADTSSSMKSSLARPPLATSAKAQTWAYWDHNVVPWGVG